MMLFLLGLAFCAVIGMYWFKCYELRLCLSETESQAREIKELSELNDTQRRALNEMNVDLRRNIATLRHVRQNYSDVVAALDKTGSEYKWLVGELAGARIRWNRKKSETVESLLARMPDLSGQWAGEVQDVGPFTAWKPDNSATGGPAAPASAVRHGDTVVVCGGGGGGCSDSSSSSCGSSSND